MGEGIDGLLNLAVRMYIAPGPAVVTSLGAYPTFNYHVERLWRPAGQRALRERPGETSKGCSPLFGAKRARWSISSNPDNPMGTWWAAAEIPRLSTARRRRRCWCSTRPMARRRPSAAPAARRVRPNVLRMRTFSKAYGLAGMRCGYAVGEAEVIRRLEKVRNHYGDSRMAQMAGGPRSPTSPI